MKKQTALSLVAIFIFVVLVVYLVRAHHATGTQPSEQSSDTTAMPSGNSAGIETTNPSSTNTSMDQSHTTLDGLGITIVKEGTGDAAVNGDSVTVNYTGMFTDGKAFDSNVDPKFQHVEPFSFTLGQHQVIAGWEEGVLGMKVGEKRHLVIPASLGYGAAGAGGVIPPNATLEFDVEVTAISHK